MKKLIKDIKNLFTKNTGKLFCIITAIALIIGVLNPIIEKIIDLYKIEHPYTASKLEIADISVKYELLIPVIDIKIRNIGETVAFIHHVKILVTERVNLLPIYDTNDNGSHSRIEYTGFYDINLSEHTTLSNLSQKIDGNDVDRFALKIAASEKLECYSTICTFKIIMYYNENQCIESEPLTIAFDYTSSLYDNKYANLIDKEILKENYAILDRIYKYDSIKSNEFIELYYSYKNNQKDFF